MNETMKAMIEENIKILPNKPAFVYGEKRLTFREYGERTNRLLNALGKMGVKKGDRISMMGNNSNMFFEVISAAIRGGIIIAPINVNFKGNEMLYLLNDSGAKVLFLETEYYHIYNSIKSEAKTVEHLVCFDGDCPGARNYEQLLMQSSPEPPYADVGENDPVCIIYTSGTTGYPKGVLHTHKSILFDAIQKNRVLQVRPEQVMLNVLPPFHYGGTFGFIIPCHLAGCTCVLLKRFRTEDALKIIEKERINGVHLVPSMVIFMLDFLKSKKYDLSSMQTVLYLTAPMPVDKLLEAFNILPKNVFVQYYALTEAGAVTALKREEHRTETERDRRILGSCGTPYFYPKEDVKLVDDEDREVPVGQSGEIVVRGEGLMREYWNKPEDTKQTIRNGWLHTGDIARFDDEGYLYVVDRKKDMIIRGGTNIYPREIEEILYKHPAILEVSVIGVPDEKLGEEVKAVVVLKKGEKASQEEIMKFCEERLANYKKPKSVDFVDELPKTPSGKILKRELRTQYWKRLGREI